MGRGTANLARIITRTVTTGIPGYRWWGRWNASTAGVMWVSWSANIETLWKYKSSCWLWEWLEGSSLRNWLQYNLLFTILKWWITVHREFKLNSFNVKAAQTILLFIWSVGKLTVFNVEVAFSVKNPQLAPYSAVSCSSLFLHYLSTTKPLAPKEPFSSWWRPKNWDIVSFPPSYIVSPSPPCSPVPLHFASFHQPLHLPLFVPNSTVWLSVRGSNVQYWPAATSLAERAHAVLNASVSIEHTPTHRTPPAAREWYI